MAQAHAHDTGKYYVSPKHKAFKDGHDEWVFYGDGKKMYQQRVIGSSTDDNGYEWVVWSPRVRPSPAHDDRAPATSPAELG